MNTVIDLFREFECVHKYTCGSYIHTCKCCFFCLLFCVYICQKVCQVRWYFNCNSYIPLTRNPLVLWKLHVATISHNENDQSDASHLGGTGKGELSFRLAPLLVTGQTYYTHFTTIMAPTTTIYSNFVP